MGILIGLTWYVVGFVICLGFSLWSDRTFTKEDLSYSLRFGFFGPLMLLVIAAVHIVGWLEDDHRRVLLDFRKKEPPAGSAK